MISIQTGRRASMAMLTAATALAMVALATMPAAAQAVGRANPNTPTASDGSTLTVPNVAAQGITSSSSYNGAGVPTGGGDKAVDEGGIGTQSIFAPDERYRVNPTTGFPYRAVALITFTGGRCTGWLYGNNTVGTAGHCVHSGGSGGAWKSNVVVYPGYNGSSGAPYGSCTAKSLHSVAGWTTSANHEYDYGTIKLNCTVGNTTGWFGYFWQGASLNGLPTRVCGYPGDKPLEQWCGDRHNGAQATVVNSTAQKVYYYNDTVGGVSGAAVFYNRAGCGECSMAFHGYGGSQNSGKRITEAAFNNMQAWKALP